MVKVVNGVESRRLEKVCSYVSENLTRYLG